MLHPSVQVGRYQMYLVDTHTAFYSGEGPVNLNGVLLPAQLSVRLIGCHFRPEVQGCPPRRWPLFTMDDVGNSGLPHISRVSEPGGMDVLRRVEDSEYRPSKKLMDHVSSVIKGYSRVRPS